MQAVNILHLLLLPLAVLSIWPQPRYIEEGSSTLRLSPNFTILYKAENVFARQDLPKTSRESSDGFENPLTTLPAQQAASATQLLERWRQKILSNAFVPWKFHPRRSAFEPNLQRSSSTNTISNITVERNPWIVNSSSIEAYNIQITEQGEATIYIKDEIGLNHALATFAQLFYRHHDPSLGIYMVTAPLQIQDEPAFEHRGLNLDISRNIITPKDVMRTIEGLAFSKFNRLHLHASDAQSWPLEIPSIPDLARKGAYHESQVWTTSDLHAVQFFGAERGIQVYIELDMPGHTASVHEAFPELITSFNRKPWQNFSAQPPAGQLKLQDKAVETFVSTLLQDLLTRTRPFSPLVHLGGDEITATAYNLTTEQLRPNLQAFVDHTIALIHAHGSTPVVWEELVLDHNLSLPRDTIVQAWRGSSGGDSSNTTSSLAHLVARGHRALFGANSHWYLDCGHGTWLDPNPNRADTPPGGGEAGGGSPIHSPFLDYCSPLKNWRQVYSYYPFADVADEDRPLVLGGEVHLWGELTDGANLDAKLWPRAAAAGEVLWSGGGDRPGERSGVVGETVTRRLAEWRERIVRMGIGAGPVQVTWCLMNEGSCVL